MSNRSIMVGLIALLAALIPSMASADDGLHYESIQSYDALDNAEQYACGGSGKDHESEVKYYVSSNPHQFQVDHVKQWGRITDFGLARDGEWSIKSTKYYKVVNQNYVLEVSRGEHPTKRAGGHCSTMDSYQQETADVWLDNGALVKARTRYDWCLAGDGGCAQVYTEYSLHNHYLQD